jgi:glutamate dehydrogenase/leucine dehydrogenase
MTKKYEEKSQMRLLELMGYEKEEGKEFEGASELDIVYSGLEEIMSSAVKENWDYAVKKNLSFRDACLVNAIGKVYKSYKENGIMI